MKFFLYYDECERVVLQGAQNGRPESVINFPTIIRQLDETDVSAKFLEEANECFMENFSCNATSYVNYLRDVGLGNLMTLTIERQDYGRLIFKLEGRMLKILKTMFNNKSNEVFIKLILDDANVKRGYTVMEKKWASVYNDEMQYVLKYHQVTEDKGHQIFTKGMKIEVPPDQKLGFCLDDTVEIPKYWKAYLEDQIDKIYFFAKIRVEVCIAGFTAEYKGTSERITSDLNKRILEHGTQSDVVLIAGDGNEIKCHKSFLAARSPVFTAMFRSDCKESTTNQVEMKDMTEEGIKAFLAYLYYGGLAKANESCKIAFELFEAGHKYEVASLEEDVKHILRQQSTDWFDVTVALRLFSVYGMLEGFEDLRTKALQIMKLKYDELEECEDFKMLFAKDPAGAMLLCKYSFSA